MVWKTKPQDWDFKMRSKGKTPPGTHVPVLVKEVMLALKPLAGQTIIDCTLGYGGHTAHFANNITNAGKLIALDVDSEHLENAKRHLKDTQCQLSFHNTNFSNIAEVLQKENIEGADIIFADIGVSSMQVDDPARGISYKNDGPLDMRMDPNLEKTGADLLAELPQKKISTMLWENSDEPDHEHARAGHQGDRRAEFRLGADDRHPRVVDLRILFSEAVDFALFLRERFDHSHTGDGIGHGL